MLGISGSLTHTVDNKTYILGYLIPSIITAIISLPPELSAHLLVNKQTRIISLKATTAASRTSALAAITTHWRSNRTFPILQKWRDEHMPIYAPSGTVYATIERASTPIFGLISYYIYLIAYTRNGSSSGPEQQFQEKDIRIWIQRRSLSKASHGGLLDCTVAGAIQAGQTPIESLVREAEEEASLPPSVTARATPILPDENKLLNMNISPSGVSDGEMYYRPACGFGYEVDLAGGEVPVPSDGEVAEFYCLGVREVKERLRRGEFMPHAAKVLVEWLVRMDWMSEEDDGLNHLRKREFEFPLM